MKKKTTTSNSRKSTRRGVPALRMAVSKTETKAKATKKATRAVKETQRESSTSATGQESRKPVSRSSTTARDAKYYYHFGGGKAEGSREDLDILGGKGAGLCEMSQAGIPVPPGFVVSAEVCSLFYESGMATPKDIDKDLEKHVALLEKEVGKKFGDPENPLLLSVRSGAKISMPGMMDTILNLGLNSETLDGLAKRTGNERFAYDNYRRLIQMFGNVVLGIDKDRFETIVTKIKTERKIKKDSSLQVKDLTAIIAKFKSLVKRQSGEVFPDDPYVQLRMARDAVFRSWNNPRAIAYRRMNKIEAGFGTAVTIQAMVFGNSGANSGTGVGFTRNPSTGAKEFFGEYLQNAQGEDVVAGVRTPKPISELAKDMPAAFKQLKDITSKLEKRYRDVQDFEFTIEDGKLYMLQTRKGKRTTSAAVKIAVDFVKEKTITRDEALLRITPGEIDQLLHPWIDPTAKVEVIARGLPASPGAASGAVYFTAEDAVEKSKGNKKIILVRQETSPDDIEGMEAAAGILTSRGGMTSHAAVVARGMGACCVAGAETIRVNQKKKIFQVGKLTIKEGEIITLNGSTGEVILGEVPTIDPEFTDEFNEFMEWADEVRQLNIRANADTPKDAKKALQLGAVGIGLCRTEHMFFAEDRLSAVQDMIIAESVDERQEALDRILPFQKEDFKALFDAMHGYPVTIRTLDPPLHEFLPHREEVIEKLEKLEKTQDDYDELLVKYKKTLRRVEELNEQNPMLGHRGCRLGIVYPEITEMQVRAILEAACELKKSRKDVLPEIMIPLVGHVNEFINQRDIVHRIAREVMALYNVKNLEYKVGTMIEIPRAALTAEEIGAEADFFSFGTNDLTQMSMGFSRDDVGKFLWQYIDLGILPGDPFVSIDESGVGKLIEMGVTGGREGNPSLKIGICGEHGGDPQSIAFCHRLGLDYVSCSPFRAPIARLAAAQAALTDKSAGSSVRVSEAGTSKKGAKARKKTATRKTLSKKTASKKTTTKKVAAKKTTTKKTATKKTTTKKTTTKKTVAKKAVAKKSPAKKK